MPRRKGREPVPPARTDPASPPTADPTPSLIPAELREAAAADVAATVARRRAFLEQAGREEHCRLAMRAYLNADDALLAE